MSSVASLGRSALDSTDPCRLPSHLPQDDPSWPAIDPADSRWDYTTLPHREENRNWGRFKVKAWNANTPFPVPSKQPCKTDIGDVFQFGDSFESLWTDVGHVGDQFGLEIPRIRTGARSRKLKNKEAEEYLNFKSVLIRNKYGQAFNIPPENPAFKAWIRELFKRKMENQQTRRAARLEKAKSMTEQTKDDESSTPDTPMMSQEFEIVVIFDKNHCILLSNEVCEASSSSLSNLSLELLLAKCHENFGVDGLSIYLDLMSQPNWNQSPTEPLMTFSHDRLLSTDSELRRYATISRNKFNNTTLYLTARQGKLASKIPTKRSSAEGPHEDEPSPKKRAVNADNGVGPDQIGLAELKIDPKPSTGADNENVDLNDQSSQHETTDDAMDLDHQTSSLDDSKSTDQDETPDHVFGESHHRPDALELWWGDADDNEARVDSWRKRVGDDIRPKVLARLAEETAGKIDDSELTRRVEQAVDVIQAEYDDNLLTGKDDHADLIFEELVHPTEDSTQTFEKALKASGTTRFSDWNTKNNTCANTDEKHMQETYAFFRLAPDFNSSETQLNFFKRNLKRHQLLGIMWMLKSKCGIRGGFVGDEQGLGKTFEVIAFSVILNLLTWLANDYHESSAEHLTCQQATEGLPCPIAQRYNIPFLCPCENGFPFWLQQVYKPSDEPVESMVPLGPQLAIVPLSVLSNWAREFQVSVDLSQTWPPNTKPMAIVAHQNDVSGDGTSKRQNLNAKLAANLLTDPSTQMGTREQLRYLIITTALSFESQVINKISEARTSEGPDYDEKVSFSAIYVDECHKTRNCDVALVRYLADYDAKEVAEAVAQEEKTGTGKSDVNIHRRDSDRPLHSPYLRSYLFLLSGTPWEQGPRDLLCWLLCLERRIIYFKSEFQTLLPDFWQESRDKFVKIAEAEQLQKDLDDKARRITAADLAKGKNDKRSLTKQRSRPTRAEINDVACRLADLLEHIMIRRTEETTINGKAIVQLPPLEEIHEVVLPDSLEVQEILHEMNHRFEHRLQVAIMKCKDTSKTNLVGIALHNIKLYRPIAIFPVLWKLLQEKKITKLSGGSMTVSLKDDANNTPLLQIYQPQLYDSSFRLKWIINDMFNNRLHQLDTWTDPETGQICTRSPKFGILTSMVNPAECTQAVIEWYIKEHNVCRPGTETQLRSVLFKSTMTLKKKQEIIDGFQGTKMLDRNGRPVLDGPNGAPVYKASTPHPDIIVGTIGCLGVGVNLFAASTLYILEPQFAASDHLQAVKRIHRIGQTSACRVITMDSGDEIKYEKYVRRSGDLRKLIQELVAKRPDTQDTPGT